MRIIPQVRVTEIEMVKPIVTLRFYNAKTWEYHEQYQSPPSTRTTTAEGVDGTMCYYVNITYFGDRVTNVEPHFMTLEI